MFARRLSRGSELHSSSGKSAALVRLLAWLVLVLLLVLAVAPSAALAQSAEERAAITEAARLNTEASALFNAGKPWEAEPLLRQALDLLERALGPEDPRVFLNLDVLGVSRRRR
jgi:hypothetical protein